MSQDDGDLPANVDNEPTEATAVGEFRIKVSLNGVLLGWFTDAGPTEYWITATPNEADGTVWTQVAYKGSMYLKKSTNNYLSYRSTNAIYSGGLKIRDWFGAAGWELVGKKLIGVDTRKAVGRDGDMFYVNDLNVVEIDFVPV